ncbi:MAG: hypothetical protein ACLFMO_07030 [Eubacteriales bacterium]
MENFYYKNKKVIEDLVLIIIITVIFWGLNSIINSNNGFRFIMLNAWKQFSVAGLAPVIVMVLRKEKLSNYGFKKLGGINSLIFSLNSIFIYSIIKITQTQGFVEWMPFSKIELTWMAIEEPFPLSIISILIIVLCWGFFQGFTLIFVSKKINQLFDIKNPFLRPAPILVLIVSIFIQLATRNISDFTWVADVLIAYVVVLIPEVTDNSWGSILIFFALWNAI